MQLKEMKYLMRNMRRPEKRESLDCKKQTEKEKSLNYRNKEIFHSPIKN